MAPPRHSPVPLWLTLGFALGAGFGYFVFHEEKSKTHVAPPLVVTASPAREPDPVRDAGTLAVLEQQFDRWGGYAVWENDITELAAWDPRRRRHSDFIEVRRDGGVFYFRTLTSLTRPLIDHGPRAALPFAFTEPPWRRDEFYRENPGYDPSAEPLVDLPPKTPERSSLTLPQSSGGPLSPTATPTQTPTTRPPSLPPPPGGG